MNLFHLTPKIFIYIIGLGMIFFIIFNNLFFALLGCAIGFFFAMRFDHDFI
jgi:hypothetical protein